MLTRRSSLRRFLAYVWPYYGLIARATGAGMLEFVLPSTMALSLRFLTDRLVPAQAASPAPPSDVIAAAFDHYLAWFGGLLGPFWASPEGAFQRSLSELMKGRTSIVIAHRLSTIFAADRIIVLNDGRIVQIGSHAELSRRDGLYARLYEAQRLVPENDVATPEAPPGKAGAA